MSSGVRPTGSSATCIEDKGKDEKTVPPKKDPISGTARVRIFQVSEKASKQKMSVAERKLTVLSSDEALGEFEIQADEIVERVFLGNKDNAYNQKYLQALGITHILNTALQAECPHEKHFTYMKIPLLDSDEVNILRHFNSALDFIDKARREGKILVHCMSGMSRSAAFMAAWMIRNERLTFDEALDKMMDKRSIVDPNEGFRKQLEIFADKEHSRKH